MPVTSSARKASRVAARRLQENLLRKVEYKRALKVAHKARTAATKEAPELTIKAQSTLDRAVKSHLLHRNTASRLFARLIKTRVAAGPVKKARSKKRTA